MQESGLYDISEKLEVVPKYYYITRNKKVKFTCKSCYGGMANTPSIPSIIPTSNYADSLIIDVALSKYCDLIPIERYAAIAGRLGLTGLPANSLIEGTHHLANFLEPVEYKIKMQVKESTFLSADETPSIMLEGDEKKNWYLWAFLTRYAVYFEAHNTRSSDVIKNFLIDSKTNLLLSDGYAAYSKATKDIKIEFDRSIILALCNAHAYRYFKEASSPWLEETKIFLEIYGKIYELERSKKNLSPPDYLQGRQEMIPLFEKMKLACEQIKDKCMPGSSLLKSVQYFLNNYEGLIVCTGNIQALLDNNITERSIRSHVIGRKTWYGNHSEKGANTSATLFSIIQSCHINNINPRNYFPWIVTQIHKKGEILTPYEYSLR